MMAQEDLHHGALRAAIQAFPVGQRDIAYTAIREFLVRHPAVAFADRERFVVDGGLVAAAGSAASRSLSSTIKTRSNWPIVHPFMERFPAAPYSPPANIAPTGRQRRQTG